MAAFLVADAPAVVSPFDNVDQSGWVAVVGVVVAGEEIAVLVEDELLRIAQARGIQFQPGAVGIAAEDGAGFGIVDGSCRRRIWSRWRRDRRC